MIHKHYQEKETVIICSSKCFLVPVQMWLCSVVSARFAFFCFFLRGGCGRCVNLCARSGGENDNGGLVVFIRLQKSV